MFISEKKVDILMATYNGEKYIKQQLDSLLNQTFSDFNLIIADDKSTDSTLEILLDYQKRDSRIHVIQNEINLGVIKNFEQLINLSNAEYFMLCDQDDVWLEEKIEKSLDAIKETNAMIAFTDLQLVDQDLNVKHQSYLKYQGISEIKNIHWKTLLVQNIVTGCTIIANKKIKKYALPFPKNIPMHDAWLALVGAVHGEIKYINDVTLQYRQHESNAIGGHNSYDRMNLINNSYTVFLKNRESVIKDNINSLLSYKKINENEVIDSINILINYYSKFLRIKYFKFSLDGFVFKLKFKSFGLFRNLWWIIYLNFPIIAYVMLMIRQALR